MVGNEKAGLAYLFRSFVVRSGVRLKRGASGLEGAPLSTCEKYLHFQTILLIFEASASQPWQESLFHQKCFN